MSVLLGLMFTAHAADPSFYLQARGIYANSAIYEDTAVSYTGDLGFRFDDGNMLGFRMVYSPAPVPIYLEHTPKVAVGGALVLSHDFVVSRVHLVPTAALGIVGGENPVLLEPKYFIYAQGGLAARLRLEQASGSAVVFGPEVGLVPLLLAPYIGFDLTWFSPRLGSKKPYYQEEEDTTVEAGGARGLSALPTVGARVALTLEPALLAWDDHNGTVTYSPGSDSQSATYTRYVMWSAAVEQLLGGRPTSNRGIIVQIDTVEEVVVNPTPPSPAPDGGIRVVTCGATPVGVW